MSYYYFTNSGELVPTADNPTAEILDYLIKAAKANGKPLKEHELRALADAPSMGAINRWLGSIDTAITLVERELAKNDPPSEGVNEMGGKRRTDEEIMQAYHDLWTELGTPPSLSMVDDAAAKDGRICTSSVIATRFGGIEKLRAKVIELYGDPTASEPEPVAEEAPEPEPESTPGPESESAPAPEPAASAEPEESPESEEAPDPTAPEDHDLESEPEGDSESGPAAEAPNRFINWLPWPVRFVNGDNQGAVIPPNKDGKKLCVYSALDGYFASGSVFALCNEFGAVPGRIFAESFQLYVRDVWGEIHDFPAPADGVFHIVDRDIILAAIASGRPVHDLFYPLLSENSRRFANQAEHVTREICELREIEIASHDE